ncbi:MAG: hypothetical protein KBE41_06395 [Lutibacter sp.]|nr:hypothetical protein [Lutibacter sp.]MBP9601112.1 hypothetical protein [Lutibacter sp.]
MEKLIYIFILTLVLISCSSEDDNSQNKYEFIKKYTATVTVGGAVGILERNFEVGETFKGTDEGGKTISIRIAEHSELNEDCPNSWCYQEFLDVPKNHLKRID